MKSLIGKLQFTTSVVTTGRCFQHRLHDSTMGVKRLHYKLTITKGVKDYLKVGETFSNLNGHSLLSFQNTETSDSLHMFTDGSKCGYGGTFLDKYIVGIFPPCWQSQDIQFLELYPIFTLIHLLAHKLSHNHNLSH